MMDLEDEETFDAIKTKTLKNEFWSKNHIPRQMGTDIDSTMCKTDN